MADKSFFDRMCPKKVATFTAGPTCPTYEQHQPRICSSFGKNFVSVKIKNIVVK